MQLKRVVVTGMGALTPIGNTLAEYWKGIKSGKNGAAPITRFDTTLFKTRFACEVKGFDITQFMDRKEARKMDPFTQYGVVVADQAIDDSGLLQQPFNPDRIGVIWGSGIGGLTTFFQEVVDLPKATAHPGFHLSSFQK